MFCPIDRVGNLRLGRVLTGEAIRQILSRRTLAAGLAAMSPHDLRRIYAGDLLDAGADLPAAQQLMGHASPWTTSRLTVAATRPGGQRPSGSVSTSRCLLILSALSFAARMGMQT